MEAGQLWRQYIIAGVANIAVVATGYCMGWTSPMNIKLGDARESPLPDTLNEDQLAWVGSLLTVGAIFGPFIGGFAASRIGRKWGLLSSAIPLFIGWILIVAASSESMIYAGRVFWGLAAGMVFTLCPMYCAEIATVDCRGALGSFLQIFVVLGFQLIYVIGPFISYSAVAYVGVATIVLFCVLFFFMPESPMYYLSKDDVDSAARCLAIIRGRSRAGVQAELDKMAAEISASMEKTANIADVFRGSNFKAFYICCFLVFFQQFCGINAVLFYMTHIFKAAGSNLDASIATIVIGGVQVGASFITPLVVDRLGRRILMMVSSCGTAVGLGLLGMYFILYSSGSPVVSSIGFLPVLSLVLFIIAYCWGLGPLPWALMSELLPMEVKAIAAPIATAFCWVLSFLVTRYFNSVALALGMGGTFVIFGGCCVISFFFSLLVVPETKGKSFQEIQIMLSGKLAGTTTGVCRTQQARRKMADKSYAYEYDPVDTGNRLNREHRLEPGQLWRQYVIAGVANIAVVAIGYCLGWTSPVNIVLKDPTQTPLPGALDEDQLAWVGSLLNVGAIFGPFIGGFAASRIGRKWGLLSSAIPLFIGWILIATASSASMIYAGRVSWGLTVGMVCTLCPMYCAEIATDDCRGALGSFLQMFIVFGFLLMYVIGPFVSYSAVAYVGVATVILFCVLFFFMPESPMYYLSKDDVDSAARCLAIIRGRSRAGVQAELDKMAAEIRASMEKTANIADVFRGSNFKAFYICCFLVSFQQFCGINAVLFYMTDIFKAAGSKLNASIATIIIGGVQVGASSITPLVVDRLGRRILMMISSCGTAVGLALLGIYFVLDSNHSTVVSSIGFLPVLSLVLFIIAYCLGLGPLPWALMSELLPIEVKAIAAPIATAFCWFLSFLVTRYFSSVAIALGMGGTFFIFGGCCVVSFLFSFFVVPETKGKSFQEIQDMLANKSKQEKA